MKIEPEIRTRIREVICEMERINERLTGNELLDLFTYNIESKNSRIHFDEIKHLFWVLEEDIPKYIVDLQI